MTEQEKKQIAEWKASVEEQWDLLSRPNNFSSGHRLFRRKEMHRYGVALAYKKDELAKADPGLSGPRRSAKKRYVVALQSVDEALSMVDDGSEESRVLNSLRGTKAFALEEARQEADEALIAWIAS